MSSATCLRISRSLARRSYTASQHPVASLLPALRVCVSVFEVFELLRKLAISPLPAGALLMWLIVPAVPIAAVCERKGGGFRFVGGGSVRCV